MLKVTEQFGFVIDDPYLKAREEKNKGKTVIGIAPMHFPEELIHSAGGLPILLQGSTEPIDAGFNLIHPIYCGLVRSLVSLCSKGKLNFFDAIFFPNTCLQIWAAANLLRKNLPNTKIVFAQMPTIPERTGALGEAVTQLRNCASEIEGFTEQRISNQDLTASIQLYNRHRKLLTELYELRRERPDLLQAAEFSNVVQSSMVMPKEEHNALVEKLLVWLRQKEGATAPPKQSKPRIFLSGHLCHALKLEILRLIEELGAVVVDDDLYTGRRYFTGEVDLNGEPLEALARKYITLPIPCPTKASPRNDYGEYLVSQVHKAKVQGIIYLVAKFCEPHMFSYPDSKKVLDKAGIPNIIVETEHEMMSLEGPRTKLQAFFESMQP